MKNLFNLNRKAPQDDSELKKSFVRPNQTRNFNVNTFLEWHHAIITEYQPVTNVFYNH